MKNSPASGLGALPARYSGQGIRSSSGSLPGSADRSKDLINLVTQFQEKDIKFRSLNDAIDTTAAQCRLIFNIFGSLAEFERRLIRERTKAGLVVTCARGRMGGKTEGLSKEALNKAILSQVPL